MNQQLTDEELKLLDDVTYGSYTIKDGKINVKGDVWFRGQRLATLPFQFDTVLGDFECSNIGLTSLIGCPRIVDGDFACRDNELTNLEYFPEVVRGSIRIYGNDHLQLNDKLFSVLAKMKKSKIDGLDHFLKQLKGQIPAQFGVTNSDVINEIWESYLDVLNSK